MSRRDMIIITVLINVGLLALLFMLAINPQEESAMPREQLAIAYPQKENVVNVMQKPTSAAPVVIAGTKPATAITSTVRSEELDTFLQHYPLESTPQLVSLEEHKPSATASEYTEVTVKRGDYLDKIARNNGTTVTAIKHANGLTSEKVVIGQVLRIPKGVTSVESPKVEKQTVAESTIEGDYYVVKSGDSPWKIAKKFDIRVDELLELNHLDEDKARNLKIGDKLRIR